MTPRGAVAVEVGPTPPAEPARTGGLRSGGAGGALLTPGPGCTDRGGPGDHRLPLFAAVQPPQGPVFDDPGDMVIQLAGALRIVCSILAAAAGGWPSR